MVDKQPKQRSELKKTKATGKKFKGFTDEERVAMKERIEELRAASRPGSEADGETTVRAKIAAMPEPDRTMGKRLHAIIKASAPALSPRLWYGMPAYTNVGKVICFFQPAQKSSERGIRR